MPGAPRLWRRSRRELAQGLGQGHAHQAQTSRVEIESTTRRVEILFSIWLRIVYILPLLVANGIYYCRIFLLIFPGDLGKWIDISPATPSKCLRHQERKPPRSTSRFLAQICREVGHASLESHLKKYRVSRCVYVVLLVE